MISIKTGKDFVTLNTLKTFVICGLAPLALLNCGAGDTEPGQPMTVSTTSTQASPNIIFIITDDQGWTSVSYPSDPDRPDSASDYFETPNMATLASEGMRFSQAYTPNPICAPARHAMLFGQRTTRHKYNRDKTWIDRAPGWLTIPKAIKAANPEYRTAHFGKWHVGVKPELAGFDYSDGLTDNEEGDRHAGRVFADINHLDQKLMDAYNQANGIDTTPANPGMRDRSATFYTHEDPKTAFSLTARASAFIREAVADGKPFYAHIAHYAVHTAFSAREDSFARFRARPPGVKHDDPAFAAMLFDLDEAIGQVMELVKELGIEDNTYIVVISDNGGVAYFAQTSQIDADVNILGTHRTRIPWNNAPLREGKHSFYEGGLRVPFIIAGPNIEPGSHSDEPITGLDLLPTFARLAGYQGTLAGPLDGESLVALIDGSNETVFERKNPTLIFHQAGRRPGRSAVREGRYKLVKNWNRRSEVNGETLPYTLALYDLDTDIGEQNDLAGSHPEIVAGLHGKLLRHIAEVNSEFADNPGRDPMSLILERDGQGRNRKEQLDNRKPVVVEYVSPYALN
jgi:arylsulfatase A-like enzyme